MLHFNEDTRVKFPATIQFLRLGYEYQSLKGARIDFETKIFIDRFKTSLERINKREISNDELFALLAEINTLIKNNDLGKEFYKRLLSSEYPIRLLDLDNFNNNDFAVVNELPFSIKEGTEEGSFRPDINILINGMPLAFLEVKHPDNSGGIQVEFERMINKRLKNDDYKKYFNLIQVISFQIIWNMKMLMMTLLMKLKQVHSIQLLMDKAQHSHSLEKISKSIIPNIN